MQRSAIRTFNNSNRSSKRRRSQFRSLKFDTLESRQLLAAVMGADLFADSQYRVVLTFHAPLDAASVDAADLLVDQVPVATGVNLLTANSVEFILPALTAATHNLSVAVGALSDQVGNAVDAWSKNFTVVDAAQLSINQSPRLQLGDAPLTGYAGSDKDQVDILWQTIPAGIGSQDAFVVEYRTAASSSWQIAANQPVIATGVQGRQIHSATATGLAWNTDHVYRVRHLRGDVIVRQYESTFRTRLAADDPTPFSFAVYGDAHANEDVAAFRSVQSQINQLNPSFAVLLGDNASDNGSHLSLDARFDPAVNPEAAAWIASHVDYVSIGNHDIVTQAGLPTEQSFSVPKPIAGVTAPFAPPVTERPEHNYSWDYGDVHFVTFDSNSFANPTRLAAQLEWVVADLNASTARWKIVYAHHPLAAAPFMPHTPAENYYQQVVSRLKGAGVDLLMVGHTHTYSWTYPLQGQTGGAATYVNRGSRNEFYATDGLTQLVVGTGHEIRSGDYNQYPFVAAGYSTSSTPRGRVGFAAIDVTSDALNIRYIAADTGETIDTLRILDAAPPVDAPLVSTFQQRLTSYTGTVDTVLRHNSPTTSGASATSLVVDSDDPGATALKVQSLLRFDNLFGAAPGQIPLDATIESATLQLRVTNDGHAVELYRMLQPWSATDTWASLTDGISTNGIEASATADGRTAYASTGNLQVDVLTALRAWQANPSLNFGWAILPTGPNGVAIESAEGTLPPKLMVKFKSAPLVNTPPVAQNDVTSTASNTSQTIAVLANDSDADGDVLIISSVSAASYGTVTVNANNGLVYTPATDFAGTDSFQYTVSDGRGGTATASVTITVDPPVVSQTREFQQRVNGYLATVDTVLRENAPTVSAAGATNVTVDSDEPSNTNRKEQALLRFGELFGSAPGQIPLDASLQSATLTLQVTNEGHAIKLHRMLRSWSDTDTWTTLASGIQADGVEAAATADATTEFLSVGTITINVLAALEAWRANPDSNFGWALLPTSKNGVAISSAEGTKPPKLSVTFIGQAPPNRAPVALNDVASTAANTSQTIAVLANDSDADGDVLVISSVSAASYGTVTVNANNGLVYTPATDFAGTDSFQYTVSDGRGGTATASVTITVDPPVVSQTREFQQRVNGYLATIDTVLRENAPTVSAAGATNVTVDSDEPSNTNRKEQALLRFGDLFGSAPGQIPLDASLQSATLTLQVTNEGHAIKLHRMLRSWSDTDTWTTLASGIQADGVEAAATADATTEFLSVGTITINVLAALEAWRANPDSNFGWALLPTSKNGVAISSAEGTKPPKLSVTFMPATSSQMAYSSQRDTADVNADSTVSPLDALMIINALNAPHASLAGQNYFPDVSQDGVLSPLDALLVINRLNATPTAQAEAITVISAAVGYPSELDSWTGSYLDLLEEESDEVDPFAGVSALDQTVDQWLQALLDS